MNRALSIEPLAAHPEVLPLLREWFETEWPTYYGSGRPGNADRDLQDFSNEGCLPVGVVAFRDGVLCGFAALKAESISSHRHLTPWAAAGLVKPSERGQGIGTRLVVALEQEARKLGFGRIYCGTSTAETLLRRCGWQLLENIVHEDQPLAIYCRALVPDEQEQR